jgi:hypothetical protein
MPKQTDKTSPEFFNKVAKTVQMDQAARKIQRKFRMWQSAPEQALILKIKQPRPILYANNILDRYDCRGILGGGGSAMVYSVLEKASGKLKAYKIGDRGIDRPIEIFINYLLEDEHTPHLTRIEGTFISRSALSRKPEAYPQQRLANPALTVEEFERLDPVFKKEVFSDCFSYAASKKQNITLMEILEGNLRNEGYTLAQAIQLCTTLNLLSNGFDIITSDQKPKNVFYKTITAEDVFRGKRLIDYDYWHYRLGDHDFYIPRQEKLVKLGDYDQWYVESSIKSMDEEYIKSSLSKLSHALDPDKVCYYNLDKEELDQALIRFAKPTDPLAKILYMTTPPNNPVAAVLDQSSSTEEDSKNALNEPRLKG